MFKEIMQIFKGSARRQWPLLGVIALCVMVGACGDDQARWERQQNEQNAMDADEAKNGFTEVSTLPNGKPLYMKTIKKAGLYDRVYFTDDAITAREDCGKNCEKSITTIRH